MTSQHKTGTHPFLWQASIRPILIHFFDKLAKDRHSSIFMTSQHRTGTHPFLWQASIIPVLIHFFDKPSYRYSSILHRYVYTHIYTYLCTYIYFPEGMFTYFFDVSADVSGTQFGHQRFWGYVSSFLWSHVKLRRCLWMWKGCHGLESKTHWIHPAMGLCFSATEISCLQLMQLMQIWMEAG